jgi:hypothetical protein
MRAYVSLDSGPSTASGPTCWMRLHDWSIQVGSFVSCLTLDREVPWLTLRDAIQEADDLLEEAKEADLEFIREHWDLLRQRFAEAMRLVAGERRRCEAALSAARYGVG